jgi:hypothetical protein
MSNQQKDAKDSNRTARRFFWRIAGHAAIFLREMANLREDGIERFQRHYENFNHYDVRHLIDWRDELRALWTRGKYTTPALQEHWRRQPPGLTLQERICNGWLNSSEHGGLLVFWDRRERFIGPDPYELPALLAYCAFLCGDRMRVCRNRDCPAPYFVAGRKDQLYCSGACAAPATRAAKLRSWHRHKGEWLKRHHRNSKVEKRRE